MDSKDSPRRSLRKASLETLEDRVVMSADPLAGGLLHTQSVTDAVLEQRGGLTNAPALTQHGNSNADFWLDTATDHDIDLLLGNVEQTLASAHGVTGLTQARNAYGFIGTGQTVAIIDSGIAWDHVALGGGLGQTTAWSAVGISAKKTTPIRTMMDRPARMARTWRESSAPSAPGLKDTGVAPGVDLVGLRVFNDKGEGYYSWVENALRWVHENRNAFENPITAVNLSLGTSWNASTVPSWSTMEDELAQLKADGIFISVSAGNSFGTTYTTAGLSYPASSPYVVPVMSVDDSGQLSSFSQRQTWAIAAPGRYITSTVPDYIGNHNGRPDDYASFSGTSMAAPYVAGASVLVREAMQFVGITNITQDRIYNHLMATADSVFDSATGLTYKRLNLNNAISALMPTDDFGSGVATAHDLGTLAGTGTSTLSGMLGRLDDTDFFRFTASAAGSVSLSTTSSDGGSKWITSALGSYTDDGGTLTFNVAAGETYTIGLAAGAKVSHFQLAIHYTLVSEPPKILTAEEKAIALDGQLGLTFFGSYSTNWGGMGEKWMRGADNKWYFITPDGAFYEWSGTRDLSGSRQLAQLDSSFHDNPRLLHEASSASLTLAQLSQQLDQQLGLQFTGNYSTNWGGMGEKWMRGTSNTWYFIVPGGQLYRWNGQTNLSTSTLVAMLDGGYYTNPALLHNVTTPTTQASTVAQTQSVAKQSVATSAAPVGISSVQHETAKQVSTKSGAEYSARHEAASWSQQYTELAFAAPAPDRFAAEVETLSSTRKGDYHEAAVDELFEKLGVSFKNTFGVARP